MRRTSKLRDVGDGERYLEREAALKALGIKPQTLYAYVSRGWIRSVQKPGGGRSSLYAREDVDKVKARSSARAGHGAAAASAMRWGEPIIPTAITDIRIEGPYYRGQSAVALARYGARFEDVAELLWTGRRPDESMQWQPGKVPSDIEALAQSLAGAVIDDRIIEILTLFTLRLGMSRGTLKARLDNASPLEAARKLIQIYAAALGLLGPQRRFVPIAAGSTLAGSILRSLGADEGERGRAVIDALLVLLADHELQSSTFAARVAASAGATLHGCVTAALATASGVEIGRLYDRVEEFLGSKNDPEALLAQARSIQARGQTPPGFNHPLYPKGDPRAELLLDMAAALGSRNRSGRDLAGFLEAARRKMHLHPRVELGVVAACRALRLPRGSASALFALARTAGTVAHVMEQRSAGFLLRPRARFTAGGMAV